MILLFIGQSFFKVLVFLLTISIGGWACKSLSSAQKNNPPSSEKKPIDTAVTLEPKVEESAPVKKEEESKSFTLLERKIPEGYKNYIIRKIAFMYTDEAFEEVGPAEIKASFSTAAAAEKAILKQQKEEVKHYTLDDLFFYSSPEAVAHIQQYILDEFKENVRDTTYQDHILFNRNKGFPAAATEEQIDYLLRAGGVSLFVAVPFNETPRFYYAKPNPKFWELVETSNGKWAYQHEYVGPMVLDSKDATTKYADKQTVQYLGYGRLKGRLESLSETPELLKAYIESQKDISYNETSLELTIKSSGKVVEGLLALLKEKAYSLEELSVEEYKTLVENWKY